MRVFGSRDILRPRLETWLLLLLQRWVPMWTCKAMRVRRVSKVVVIYNNNI
jgi:hypothetical protein